MNPAGKRLPWHPSLALLPPLAAFLLEWLAWPGIRPHVWFLFYPAVFFASGLGGLGWGIAATVLSGLLILGSGFLPAFQSIPGYPPSPYAVAAFLVMGVLFSRFHDRLRRARQDAEDALEKIRALEAFKSQFLVSMLNQSNQDKTRYLGLFEHMTAGFAHGSLICEDGEAVDFLFLEINPAFTRITGLEGVAGRTLSAVLPGGRAVNPELFETCVRVARTGVTGRLKTYSERLGIWLSFNLYSPAAGEFVALFDPIRLPPGPDALADEIRRQGGTEAVPPADTLDNPNILPILEG